MREIVLDTETTGLDPAAGHRIVEIGAVELLNHVPTGMEFHRYLNPQRDMPTEAFNVHGLSAEFLANKALFAEIVEELLSFLGDSRLVIHNAAFDVGFLNAELGRVNFPRIAIQRATDTVELARRKFPGAPANLDALCRRFQIDLSDRALHGALKDAQLLAQVYLELQGGREPGLSLASASTKKLPGISATTWKQRIVEATAEERVAHEAFVGRLANSVWETLSRDSDERVPVKNQAARAAR